MDWSSIPNNGLYLVTNIIDDQPQVSTGVGLLIRLEGYCWIFANNTIYIFEVVSSGNAGLYTVFEVQMFQTNLQRGVIESQLPIYCAGGFFFQES